MQEWERVYASTFSHFTGEQKKNVGVNCHFIGLFVKVKLNLGFLWKTCCKRERDRFKLLSNHYIKLYNFPYNSGTVGD